MILINLIELGIWGKVLLDFSQFLSFNSILFQAIRYNIDNPKQFPANKFWSEYFHVNQNLASNSQFNYLSTLIKIIGSWNN